MQDWSGTKLSRVAIQRREEYIESEPKAAVAPVVRGGGPRRSQIDADVGGEGVEGIKEAIVRNSRRNTRVYDDCLLCDKRNEGRIARRKFEARGNVGWARKSVVVAI